MYAIISLYPSVSHYIQIKLNIIIHYILLNVHCYLHDLPIIPSHVAGFINIQYVLPCNIKCKIAYSHMKCPKYLYPHDIPNTFHCYPHYHPKMILPIIYIYIYIQIHIHMYVHPHHYPHHYHLVNVYITMENHNL